MGVPLGRGFLVIALLHCTYPKLMYLNGIQQKDLTPVNPDDVDAVISGLQMYAQVVRQDAEGTPGLQRNTDLTHQQQNYSSEGTEDSTIHAPTNSSKLSEEAPKSVPDITNELPVIQSQNEIKFEKGISPGTNVLESIQSLLGMLKTNSSNLGLFITNFASMHNLE